MVDHDDETAEHLERYDIPVHGVLAVEGKPTGDRRQFAEGSLTWRNLPLPLLWQKSNNGGHDGSVVVGRIEDVQRQDDGSLSWSGHMTSSPEADESLGLIADQSLRGVSVDVDDATMELRTRDGATLSEGDSVDQDDVLETLTSARICAATIVAIPAFAEAYIAVGDTAAQGESTEEFRDVSTKERKERASSGSAMPDGSFPIANEQDLKNAIQAVGRAKDPDKAKAHIKKRAKSLGKESLLPDSWSEETSEFAENKDVRSIVESLPLDAETIGQLLDADEADLPDAVRSIAQGADDDVKAALLKAADQIEGMISGPPEEEMSASGVPGLPELSDEEADRITSAAPEEVPDVLDALADEAGEGEKADQLRRAAAAMREAIEGGQAPPEEAAASTSEFADVAPGLTEDGPGWLTHPVDTDRLRDYWVHGAGAAKIGWGIPGDFNRCRALTVKYVGARHISGYCANRHHDALGVWPGQEAAGATVVASAGEPVAPMYRLVASGAPNVPPMDWFANPGLQEPTPLTITQDGQVFGHVAVWDTCHVGFEDSCVTPPSSGSEYSYFLSGLVETDGGDVRCGQITFDTGHAGLELNSRRSMAHYDDTGHCAADVMAGEDDIGIWVAGALRSEVTDEQIRTLRGAKMSGDWRNIGGNLEMVAVLAVNVPGFPIPRPALAASAGHRDSLVAAGMVPDAKAGEFTVEEVVEATLAQMDSRREASRQVLSLSAQIAGDEVREAAAMVASADVKRMARSMQEEN